MEVVNVLRDDPNVVGALQIDEGPVRGVRLCRPHLSPPLVVKLEHEDRVFGPGLGRGHILDAMTLPEAAVAAKGLQAAFGAHASASEHDDIFPRDFSGHGRASWWCAT